MTETDRHILKEFARRIRQRFPEADIWAFGSRARGNADADSDLDVCVVVDGLDEDKDRQIMAIAWEVGFAVEIVISTVTFSQDELTNGPLSESAIVREIRRDGVAA